MGYTEKTDAEIRQLALDITESKVFASWMLDDPRMIQSVFMPLMFLSQEHAEGMKNEKIAHFYEYYDKAGPRSINGLPIFMSMNMLNQTDVQRLVPEIKRAVAMKEAFMNSEGTVQ